MAFLHIVVLALIQGITEFLPISSSGHLALVPALTGWKDQGLILDVAVHVGTLGAVILYFWRDVWKMTAGFFGLIKGKRDGNARLTWHLILATLPAIAAGYALNKYIPDGIRGVEIIAWTTLGFGVLLFISDKMGLTVRRMEHLHVSDALIIGCAQVLALIPGTSRSGITMTAARLLGMERTEAARFSMLMSIPVILGAGTLKGLELYEMGDQVLTATAFLAAGLALVSALVAISVLMFWLRRATFTPFAVYRVVLGLGLLAFSYGWIG